MNAWRDLKSSCHRHLPERAYFVSCQIRLCKIKYGFEGSISNVDLGSIPGSTPDFNLVQIRVQGLLLQSLLKVTTTLEDVTKCYIQCIYVKKEKIKVFLTGLFSSSHFIQFTFVTYLFC